MSYIKMHDQEIDIDAELVKHLLNTQFPKWANLPIQKIPSDGTVNAIFRLGAELCILSQRKSR